MNSLSFKRVLHFNTQRQAASHSNACYISTHNGKQPLIQTRVTFQHTTANSLSFKRVLHFNTQRQTSAKLRPFVKTSLSHTATCARNRKYNPRHFIGLLTRKIRNRVSKKRTHHVNEEAASSRSMLFVCLFVCFPGVKTHCVCIFTAR
jgi:hypothetical protein